MIPSPTVLPNGELAVPGKGGKRGKLLSSDEIQLLRNTADSLKSFEHRNYIYTLTEKEFITEEEKAAMDEIMSQAISNISGGMDLGA